jgi:protein-tyrosine phosphatase
VGVSSWDLTVDLTCEFPEPCKSTTKAYLNVPVWDGTPPSTPELEKAAAAIAKHWGGPGKGTVMVHCAHGRGRSCMVACAGLVKAGHVNTWEEAFEVVKRGRPCCKLNAGMRRGLADWAKTQ